MQIITYIRDRRTFSTSGWADDVDKTGSSEISVLPIPRTLTSFTRILRSGIVKPNSVSYLVRKNAETFKKIIEEKRYKNNRKGYLRSQCCELTVVGTRRESLRAWCIAPCPEYSQGCTLERNQFPDSASAEMARSVSASPRILVRVACSWPLPPSRPGDRPNGWNSLQIICEI